MSGVEENVGGVKRVREECRSLNEELQAKRWMIVEQLPDGNCLFRAVAAAVYGDPNFCDKVRQQVRVQWSLFCGFLHLFLCFLQKKTRLWIT